MGKATKILAMLKNDWDANEKAPLEITAANLIAGAYNVYNTSKVGFGVSDGSIGFNPTCTGADVTTDYSIWTLVYKDILGSGTGGSL
jgi:hypothetical protein